MPREAGQDFVHGRPVSKDGGASRVFGIVSGVTMLVVAVREFVSRHGRAVVASSGSSGVIFTAGGAG